MPDNNIFVDGRSPVSFAASPSSHARVFNAGPEVVYYKRQADVTESSNEGSVAKGASLPFEDGPRWFISKGKGARLFASYSPEATTDMATQAELDDLESVSSVVKLEAEESTAKLDSLTIFPAEAYGAVGDDETDNTASLQAALDAIAAAGGGTLTGSGVFQTTELLIHNNTTIAAGMTIKRLDGNTDAYLLRNEDYLNGNEDITLLCEVDGNKSTIAGDRAEDVNPSAEIRFVADDEHRCRNIHINCYQHDAKRIGTALANVEGGSVKGLFENNGRDGVNLQSNTSNIDLDYIAKGCSDDGLGLNAEQDADLVHDMHDIRGRVAIYGPGEEAPTLGLTIRGARDIDLDLTVEGVEGWALGIFDAYQSDAKNITIRGHARECGGDATFYSQAAVVLGAGVIHKPAGPWAAIEHVNLDNFKVISPGEVGTEIKSARGAYGSLQHIVLSKPTASGASTGVLLGDYLYDIEVRDPTFVDCANGFVSTNSNVLRLWVLEPTVYNVTGYGVRIENASTGALTGLVVANDGKNGQTGVKLKALTGTWRFSPFHITECTTAETISEIGTPTYVGVGTTGLQDDAVTPAKLALVTTEKAASGALETTEAFQDVPGLTYTTTSAGSFLVLVSFDVSAGGSGFNCTGQLLVDGVAQTPTIIFSGTASGDRKPAARCWLATAAAGKVLKMQAKRSGATAYTVQPTHSTMIVIQIG